MRETRPAVVHKDKQITSAIGEYVLDGAKVRTAKRCLGGRRARIQELIFAQAEYVSLVESIAIHSLPEPSTASTIAQLVTAVQKRQRELHARRLRAVPR